VALKVRVRVFLIDARKTLGTTVMTKWISAKNIKIKRAYEKPDAEDGLRILIDRLWPRGLTKDKAAIDHWFKEIAPSTKLRKWFSHDPDRWVEFRRRYVRELKSHVAQLGEIRKLARNGPITLVYAAHDELHNDAVVLRDILLRYFSPLRR
jgi:uncharacterized protein YeaO (DUF488 family)